MKLMAADDTDRLLELESSVRDNIDDVRLLVLENIVRRSGKEVLSVCVLCSCPMVKVVSTKKNIQASFKDKTEIVTVNKEKSHKMLDAWNEPTLHEVLFESDVLEVINFPDNSSDPVTMVVKITDGIGNSKVWDYKIVFKSDDDWKIIPAELQEGYVKFLPPPMKYVFVISTARWESHKLGVQESVYKSPDLKDVTVTFPPCSVSKECEIAIQVIPPCPVEATEREDPDYDTDIVSLSPRLCIKFDNVPQFQKGVVVTLPLPSMPSTEEDTELCVIEWGKGSQVCISERTPRLMDTFCEIEVDGLSGTSFARMKLQRKDTQWKNDIKDLYSCPRGPLKECNILTFSDKSALYTLWVEIVESKRVEKILKLRHDQKLVQIPNTKSKTIKIQHGQRIKIGAHGSLRLPSHYDSAYMEIEFTENEEDNHLRFDVEVVDKSRCVLEFRVKEKQVHVCPFEVNELSGHLEPAIAPCVKSELLATKSPAHPETKVAKLKMKQALLLQSLAVLARQIPVNEAKFLAIELGLSDMDVDDLKVGGNKGKNLTLDILIRWRHKIDKDADVMVSELSEALKKLSLNVLASKLVKASQDNRPLDQNDFAE